MRIRLMLAGALLMVATAANAVPITFNVTGTVDTVTANLAGAGVNLGDVFNLSYTFESTTTARAGSDSSFAVFDALSALSFSVGSASGLSAAAPEIQVDNAPGAPNDRYAVLSRASEGLTGPALNSLALVGGGFRLDDLTNTVFADALLLPSALSLASFSTGGFFLFYEQEGFIGGSITSVATSVPEPGTLALFALSIIGLAVTRRRVAS